MTTGQIEDKGQVFQNNNIPAHDSTTFFFVEIKALSNHTILEPTMDILMKQIKEFLKFHCFSLIVVFNWK